MKFQYLDETFSYDGSQLHSLFAYMKLGLLGDSIVSWQGPCNVSFEHMLDGEDLRSQSPIRGSQMLHFIIEKFECPLFAGVWLQRLLASMVENHLRERLSKEVSIRREGDDIYLNEGKFSISIASPSPVSCLIHFAVNISNEGTPVKTAALSDFQLDPKEFALMIMEAFCHEVNTSLDAARKVFPAK